MHKFKTQIQNYLYQNIPLTKIMEIELESLTKSEIKMSAKLKPNKNDKDIAFAGSIQTLMTICCWSFIYSWLLEKNISAKLFIRRCSVEFDRQIDRDFTAICSIGVRGAKKDFLKNLKNEGKARITLSASIKIENVIAAKFTGEYAAITA